MKCFEFLMLSCFIFTLLLSCCSILTTADTMKVCPREQLTLECQSSLQDNFILEWKVYVPYCNKTYCKLFSKDGVRDPKTVEIESMVVLSLNRTSESGDLPLVSQLSINNVSVNLNGIRINCTERNNDNNNLIIQTVIHIIDSDFEYPHSPQVQKEVKKSNRNNATVIMEWVQEVGVSYNVSVTPNPLESSSSGATSQLVVLYNTSYHVNIVATLCGNNMNRTVIDISIDQPGLDLNKTQELESRTSREILTAAVSSSVVTFLVMSAMILITCGYYFMRRLRCKQSSSSNQPTEPLYEDVNVLPSAMEHHLEQGVENVAYGTTKPTEPLYEDMNAYAPPNAMHQEQDLKLKENVAYRITKPL